MLSSIEMCTESTLVVDQDTSSSTNLYSKLQAYSAAWHAYVDPVQSDAFPLWSRKGFAGCLVDACLASVPGRNSTDQQHGRAGFDGDQKLFIPAIDVRGRFGASQLDDYP